MPVSVIGGRVIVTCESAGHDDSLSTRARELAQRLGLKLVLNATDQAQWESEFSLNVSNAGLTLRFNGHEPATPLRVDFDNPTLRYRIADRASSQAIARAVGIKPERKPTVLDASAGLARDAFVLATLGCEVVALERDPIIHALAADALVRAADSANPDTRQAVARIRLIEEDFLAWAAPALAPDVIYLDPMFPARHGGGRVKKEMFMLQRYFSAIEAPDGNDVLLGKALSLAGHRVVVKRPRKAPLTDTRKPTFELSGRSSRFDVYVIG